MTSNQKLGNLLVQKKIITQEQLNSALIRQKKTNLRIGEELIHSGIVSEENIISTLAELMDIPFIKIRAATVDQEVINKIPARFVTHYNFFPLREEEGSLSIAVSDPLDLYALDEIKLMLKQPIKIFLATSFEINEAIKRYYGVGAKTMAQMVDETPHLQILSKTSEMPKVSLKPAQRTLR